MLKSLESPGTSLSDLMTKVIADVKAATANKQQPRFDNGLSRPFYFVDPAVAAAQAQAALDKSKAELADLDAKLAELQKQITSSSDAQATQKLQVEQQRQQALQQAKALESENLSREAAKQKAAAEAAAKLAAERAAAQAANAKAQNDLSDLASARRAELDKLAQAGASDNPDILIETVERLEVVLKEVDGQYAAALQKSIDASNEGWDKQLASLSGQEPDITETDDEFNARIATEKSDLEARRQGELAALRQNIEVQRLPQTAAMRTQYDDTLRTLQTKLWTVTGSGATLAIGSFDRNAKAWPFIVGSADPTLPMAPIYLVAQLGATRDPKTAILALDAAVKAKALAAEFDWGITRDTENERYAIDIRAVRVRNITTNEVVVESRPNQRSAYFVAGKRSNPIQAGVGSLDISTKTGVGEGEVWIDGKKVGVTPLKLTLAIGAVHLNIRWADPYSGFSQQLIIEDGRAITVSASKNSLKVGDIGPAGGLVFYDKGKASDGWRYLEAAPKDQSAGIQWSNGSYIDIKTGTAVDTGKANTEAIIAAQGAGNYAASICKNLSINGFADWFLPSKDELILMYTNLKEAGLGGFRESWLWSSSQNDIYLAWLQDFSDGSRGNVVKDYEYAVRAVRAF